MAGVRDNFLFRMYILCEYLTRPPSKARELPRPSFGLANLSYLITHSHVKMSERAESRTPALGLMGPS